MKSLFIFLTLIASYANAFEYTLESEIAAANGLLAKVGDSVAQVDQVKWNRGQGLYFTSAKGKQCVTAYNHKKVGKCAYRYTYMVNCAPYNRPITVYASPVVHACIDDGPSVGGCSGAVTLLNPAGCY